MGNPPRLDWFSLQGTSRNNDVWTAFFSGTRSDYCKTLQSGDTIAGYKIVEITRDRIALAGAGNKTIDLPVQMRMLRADAGPWAVAASIAPGTKIPETRDCDPFLMAVRIMTL